MGLRRVLLFALLFALSALMLALSMPPFLNVPLVGYVALVPAVLALRELEGKWSRLLLLLCYGLPYSVASYSWYVDVMSPTMGLALIVAVSVWHTGLLYRGVKLESRFPVAFRVFSLPLVYALLEFAQRALPYVCDWWFIPYPKSQWGFPEALQVLRLTGISGLTFLMVLANSAIAMGAMQAYRRERIGRDVLWGLLVVLCTLGYGYYRVHATDEEGASIRVALVSDMANALSGSEAEGYYVRDTALSQRILERNLGLSVEVLARADFVVWPENEFFELGGDGKVLKQLHESARSLHAYLVVDCYRRTGEGLQDVALMVAPEGGIGGDAPKRHLFDGEIEAGFVPSTLPPTAIQVDSLRVGLGVCYDSHYRDVVRALSRDGAGLVLMPTDDDMHRNAKFPYYHATDAVFRAVENGVAMGCANTNGASILVDGKGAISCLSPVNEVSVVVGKVRACRGVTLYSRWGEWFVYPMLLVLILGVVVRGRVSTE